MPELEEFIEHKNSTISASRVIDLFEAICKVEPDELDFRQLDKLAFVIKKVVNENYQQALIDMDRIDLIVVLQAVRRLFPIADRLGRRCYVQMIGPLIRVINYRSKQLFTDDLMLFLQVLNLYKVKITNPDSLAKITQRVRRMKAEDPTGDTAFRLHVQLEMLVQRSSV